ncbi:hypothetical protein CLV28_1261 [Sediminihabitans luteus]|uniref:Uncharacterized protein n=1 Tax=Sediminihabitans luteus TaxID=1138585 RepID=A0A2M9CPH4_9CELL|nr:hypothetical protein CLV28_1261 [Sediminihabitans luteus]
MSRARCRSPGTTNSPRLRLPPDRHPSEIDTQSQPARSTRDRRLDQQSRTVEQTQIRRLNQEATPRGHTGRAGHRHRQSRAHQRKFLRTSGSYQSAPRMEDPLAHRSRTAPAPSGHLQLLRWAIRGSFSVLRGTRAAAVPVGTQQRPSSNHPGRVRSDRLAPPRPSSCSTYNAAADESTGENTPQLICRVTSYALVVGRPRRDFTVRHPPLKLPSAPPSNGATEDSGNPRPQEHGPQSLRHRTSSPRLCDRGESISRTPVRIRLFRAGERWTIRIPSLHSEPPGSPRRRPGCQVPRRTVGLRRSDRRNPIPSK